MCMLTATRRDRNVENNKVTFSNTAAFGLQWVAATEFKFQSRRCNKLHYSDGNYTVYSVCDCSCCNDVNNKTLAANVAETIATTVALYIHNRLLRRIYINNNVRAYAAIATTSRKQRNLAKSARYKCIRQMGAQAEACTKRLV